MTAEAFLYICKQTGLTMDDLDMMTLGSCLDYFAEYEEAQNPDKKKKVRRASQADFDAF
ncbi:hypothetical protein [Listeria monocytogenes]|uniref:Hypothetical phage-related protein n=1 Tax=Listeria welshimeri serovar 6b (strain ATCC 35897 / DSM 20650 / CCUG 15529 / CIP 8149 / NCTC 11857 / SLCC 5334 / V8) TaxID=386043 RepID=A0AI19_LISW6|nr:hypothetical protein [Listeria monocytogenes]EDO1185525.1 hypothetical protein [Listeria innocua]CAK20651.1 hypothetical phage-related protein [Listeria welshimeri serovar 6b str. SLCC5334]HDU7443882.1 hypothetical protein [Listeria monocytogenes]